MTSRKRTAQLLEQSLANDPASRILNLLLILLISLNVISIIIESVNPIYLQYQTQFHYFNLFSVVIFTVEYLARVWSSIDLTEHTHTSPFIGRLRYMFTPMALIDLAAILPFYLSLYIAIDLRFLRVLRMLRLFKLTRYSPALSALLDVLQKESEALIAAIVVLLIMLVISASGIYLLENESQPEVFGSIPDAMWWAIVTLTTVGYGDAVPITMMGKFFAGIIGLVGVGMLALPVAILASGFAQNLNHRRQKYNNYINHALRDGKIDQQERWELEELRKELGLKSDDALQLLDNVLRRSRYRETDMCPHCDKPLAVKHKKIE